MSLCQTFFPIGVVIRRSPGVTRWVRWGWRAIALLPGAPPADWVELRREGAVVEYHAVTLPLELWSSDTEAYLVNLSARIPSLAVVMDRASTNLDRPEPLLVTASPYEAQDYQDSGEEVVDLIPMSTGLIAWVRDFVEKHHKGEVFVKRKRDKKRVDLIEEGKGDRRIAQLSDVYRAPRQREALP